MASQYREQFDASRFRRGRLERDISAVWFFRKPINLPRRLRLQETFLDGLGPELAQEFATEFARVAAKP